MLRVMPENLEMRFYGKTTRAEFAWFVIFMGLLGLLGVGVILISIFFNASNFHHFLSSKEIFLKTVGLLSLLAIPVFFVLYVGFLLMWENKNRGRNAVKSFNRMYEKGKLPRLIDMRKEGSDIKFVFYRGRFRTMVSVVISERAFKKVMEVMEREYRMMSHGEVIELKNNDGNVILLEGEEADAYKFLTMLVSLQREEISKIEALREKLEVGEITVWEYAKKSMK